MPIIVEENQKGKLKRRQSYRSQRENTSEDSNGYDEADGMKYGGMKKKKIKKMKHGGMHKKKKVMKAKDGISVDFPLDHPDTEAQYKFVKERKERIKKDFPKLTSIVKDKGVSKERSAKFLGRMAMNRAKRLTATEGSFKTGGMSKARGTGCAIRGTKFKGIF